MPIAPRKHIPPIMPYPPGKPIEEVQREFGLNSVIKLASNENAMGPSPKAVKAMAEAASEMHLYPDGNGYYLKQALSRKLRVPMNSLVLANGSDEISDMLLIAYAGPSHNVVFSRHDFISYKLGAMMVGANVKEVPLKDWKPDLPALAKAIDDKTRLVCIANPSNPVGTMTTREDLEAFLEKVPDTTLVLLDEAYFEYVKKRDYPDGTKYLKQYPNLVVTRTFSKAYGLAGLRVGYAMAAPEVIENCNRVRPPFNCNRMAQIAALAALEDENHIKKSFENNEKGRNLLEGELKKLGLDFVPSVTNFILIDLRQPAGPICQALMQEGVILRPVAGYGLLNHARVTIGRPAENRRFIAALKRVLKKVDGCNG